MPDRMPEDLPDRMPEDMPEDMPDRMPDRMPEDISDRMPEDMSDRMPEDMPDRMPEDLPDRMPEDMPEHMPEDMPDRMPNRIPEDMSDRMPQDLPVRKCINVMVGITRSKVICMFSTNIRVIPSDTHVFLGCFLKHQGKVDHGKDLSCRAVRIGACCIMARMAGQVLLMQSLKKKTY